MKRQPLIDADVLRYEIGHCGEYDEVDEATGEKTHHVREFEFVQQLLDDRIKGICEDVEATEPPILFLTGSNKSTEIINRTNKASGEPLLILEQPFRERIATVKPYKGTRHHEKPFHFDNLTAYILGAYDCRVSNGFEADDLICIEQWSRRNDMDTIICTRDKDLRMCPGWQFGWECGLQPSFGPELVDAKGWIKLKQNKNGSEIKGVGLKFFFAQMLVGDTVDNIPGCPKIGPVKAFEILDACNTKREHELAIIEAYKKPYPDNYKEMIEEQSKLLWMVRELNEDGSPKHYEWKFE
jgi:hypothetical protein